MWRLESTPLLAADNQKPLTLALSQRERELIEAFGKRYTDVKYRVELRF
jgi:protein-S-isoprenylcysteine O-methyltransferase Ste14